MNASSSSRLVRRRRFVAGTMAVVGICCGLASATVFANEITTGRVFGTAPAGATVVISNPEYAIQRTMQVNARGRYTVGWLPIGIYTVTVVDHGQALARHPSVQVFVERGSRVDFNCADGRCSEVAAR